MTSPEPELLEPWQPVSLKHAEEFQREAYTEIAPGHKLHGLSLVPIAKSRRADDVLFRLADGRVADLHLTWRRGPEPPTWPSCQIYSSFDEWAKQVMIPDSELET